MERESFGCKLPCCRAWGPSVPWPLPAHPQPGHRGPVLLINQHHLGCTQQSSSSHCLARRMPSKPMAEETRGSAGRRHSQIWASVDLASPTPRPLLFLSLLQVASHSPSSEELPPCTPVSTRTSVSRHNQLPSAYETLRKALTSWSLHTPLFIQPWWPRE